jgi:two-component system cell cycle response regulator
MTARILVVDDLPSNLKLLEVKLAQEYYDVLLATNGPEAIDICRRGACDLVLLDVMMPDMDGFEVCRRLKSDPLTMHIPVVMVTALDQPRDRIRGLEAGADDFLNKPLDEIALMARVKNLARQRAVIDELRTRAQASRDLGFGDPLAEAAAETGASGDILLVDDRPSSVERLSRALGEQHRLTIEADGQQALFRAAESYFDLAIVSLGLEGYDGLRLLSQLRSLERTRNTALLMLAEADDRAHLLRGLDLGVNDFLQRPVDRNELLARVRTLVRNKRYADRLRTSVRSTLEMAVMDPLTGLHNRRYLDTHFAEAFAEARKGDKALTTFILDIDRFKLVNDRYGHEAGDEVLKAFARRVKSCLRGDDIVARFGGEEIVVIAPDTGCDIARLIGERIRSRVEDEPFAIDRGGRGIQVTVSIGIAQMGESDASAEDLLKRADSALYMAKTTGRNKVVALAA